MTKTVKEIAEEIGVSKQAVFKKMKREPLSTSLQGLTTTVDGRLMVSVDGEKLIKQAFSRYEPSTKKEKKRVRLTDKTVFMRYWKESCKRRMSR